MIDWKKLDKNNLPEHGRNYLVTNGRDVETAYLHKWNDGEKAFGFHDLSSVDAGDMTHYAEINLPEYE